MTDDLASQVAALRAEVAELKATQAQPQPADQQRARAQLGDLFLPHQMTRRNPGQGYDSDPAHHPAVLAVVEHSGGLTDAQFSAELQRAFDEARKDIAARVAERRLGPATPAEIEAIEARERQLRRDGRADLAAVGRALVPGMRGQAVIGDTGQITTRLSEVSCELGHARRDPAEKFCTIDGTPFRDADGHREAEDAAPPGRMPEDWVISRLHVPESEEDRRERAERALDEALPPDSDEIEAEARKTRPNAKAAGA